MVSSPRTTARPTSSSTTPPSRSTASAPFRRTSGLSTPLGAARRARRRKKCTRCNTSRHEQLRGGPPGPPRSAVHGGTTPLAPPAVLFTGGRPPWHPPQCCSRGDDPPGTPRSAVHGGATPLAPPPVRFTGGRPPWHPPQCCSRVLDHAVLGDWAGDGDETAIGQVRPRLLGGVPGQLDAAQALVPAVAVAREVVHGVAAVEVGDVVDRVGVLAAVRVGALHDLEVIPQVYREGAVCRGGRRNAGVHWAGEDQTAVVPDP